MNNHSAKLDPSDLLDFVEGAAMSAEALARVQQALVNEPALARLVEGMKGDRTGLMALADVRSPSSLLERVETAMEREALLGLASNENAAAWKLPVSRVEYSRPSVIATIGRSRWLRPVAAAAGLALVAGTVLMAARSALNRPVKGTTIAAEDHATEPGAAPLNPIDLAGNLPASDAARELPTTTDGALALGASDPAGPSTPEVGALAPFGMPLAKAVALAQEGRLIVRVRAGSLAVAIERLDPMVDKATADRALARVTGESLTVVLAAARTVDSLRDGSGDRAASPNSPNPPTPPTTLASENEISPRPLIGEQAHVGIGGWRQSGEAFALHVRPTERALMSVLQALTHGDLVKVVLDESPRGLRDELGADPASILWWASPSTWEKRAAVSVIVETP